MARIERSRKGGCEQKSLFLKLCGAPALIVPAASINEMPSIECAQTNNKLPGVGARVD